MTPEIKEVGTWNDGANKVSTYWNRDEYETMIISSRFLNADDGLIIESYKTLEEAIEKHSIWVQKLGGPPQNIEIDYPRNIKISFHALLRIIQSLPDYQNPLNITAKNNIIKGEIKDGNHKGFFEFNLITGIIENICYSWQNFIKQTVESSKRNLKDMKMLKEIDKQWEMTT